MEPPNDPDGASKRGEWSLQTHGATRITTNSKNNESNIKTTTGRQGRGEYQHPQPMVQTAHEGAEGNGPVAQRTDAAAQRGEVPRREVLHRPLTPLRSQPDGRQRLIPSAIFQLAPSVQQLSGLLPSSPQRPQLAVYLQIVKLFPFWKQLNHPSVHPTQIIFE